MTAADKFHGAVPAEGQGIGPIHGQLRRAVFLDRDGTINREVDFLANPDELELEEHAAAAVGRLNRAGYLAIVVTNQSVVARGDVTLAGLDRIHARLEHLLGLRHAHLDRIYACPHHPGRGSPGEVAAFTIACNCRKPATGSIDAACQEMAIVRNDSWFVGDTTTDMETGRRAHLKTVLVRTGYAGQDGRFPVDPDYVVADLGAAVSWILEGHPGLLPRIAPAAAAAANGRLVLIGGLAQAGKSSAAQVLKESVAAFGRTAHVIPLDSWLNSSAQSAHTRGAAAGYDVEDMLATLTRLASQVGPTALDLPVYDRADRAVSERRRRLMIDPQDLLIVEGVPTLAIDDLTRLADLRIHIEMNESERVSRLRMDARWRGTPDAAVDSLVASQTEAESAQVEKAKARADFVISAWTIQ